MGLTNIGVLTPRFCCEVLCSEVKVQVGVHVSSAAFSIRCTLQQKGLQSPCSWLVPVAGLLANLTCILAELYEMQQAMSVTVNPQWLVPHSTSAERYQDLLDNFSAYIQASSQCSAALHA